jgi:tRNA-uridine 2-sulfurtransferase
MQKRKIAIALSGGIDSLMTAALLKNQDQQLIGLHFITGFESYLQSRSGIISPGIDFIDIEKLSRRRLIPMVDQLDIALHIVDLRTEFKSHVVEYFTHTYQTGKTPNPCLQCNPSIKFGILLEKAGQLGATHIATGHYARLKPGPGGRVRLLRGIDQYKDQSYFLARLSQSQLQSALMPLGDLTKDQTWKMARQMGLQPADQHESQDICFIKNGTYGDFLKQQPGFSAQPGPITDICGNELGRHNGLHLFTIGQRRGINCPAAEPYYVVRMDPESNRLVVGQKKDLPTHSFEAEGINWIAPGPQASIQVEVRVRYRHQPVPATLNPIDTDTAQIVFDTPHPAVTPGHGAVFYHADEVLGGGWIR